MDAEILIIGAGVFGLSIARALKRAGREVLVAEADRVGAGASATPLGVLAPHTPDGWNAKKAEQFEALTSLKGYIADLENETGFSVGYRRSGRLIPLPSERYREIWRKRIADADEHWGEEAGIEIVAPASEWISPEASRAGAALCGLSARIDARKYLDALAAAIGPDTIQCGLRFERIEGGTAQFDKGRRLTAKHIVLANGADAFRALPADADGSPAGRGEKGQAAILRLAKSATDALPAALDTLPLIYSDRVYVVPRGHNTVAVGSTSERSYSDPTAPDAQLDEVIEKARRICPALEHAEVIERWARLRPRAADRRVLICNHPDHPNTVVATGGFKTGLALAHTVGARVERLIRATI